MDCAVKPAAAPDVKWLRGFEHFGAPLVYEVTPTPLPDPSWLAYSQEAAHWLHLPASPNDELLYALAGHQLLAPQPSTASAYSGHQFGVWAGQLGDGRALLLGTAQARDGQAWELQVKGSGQTPFSRRGDGRAVLRSSVREFLCSEWMDALGIPTTRALCVIASSEPVRRETIESAALVCRLAPSFLRFGHFEHLAASRDRNGMQALLSFVVERYYPMLPIDAVALFRACLERTARLVALWQAQGFCHGVMNTDNMSILGLTLDYGPFGVMEEFDPDWVCNHSDEQGRYSYRQQPAVAYWNLHQLANALTLLADPEALQEALAQFPLLFHQHYLALMRNKLGLLDPHPDDQALVDDWLTLLAQTHTDYHRAHYQLGQADAASAALLRQHPQGQAWHQRYCQRVKGMDTQLRQQVMSTINPYFVLRNWVAQEAIDGAQRPDTLRDLLRVCRSPYREHPDLQRWTQSAPDWARGLCVSCSS